jgi:hypothetical protein
MTAIQDRTAEPLTAASATSRFARHYLEMVVAMASGMVVYGVLFRSPLDPTGYGSLLGAHPYLSEFLMLVAMSMPMVAFMLYRGHGWLQTAEMVVGMVVPSVAVICIVAISVVPFLTDSTLSVSSHVAMLMGMLLAMLYRRTEYAGSHAHHRMAQARAGSGASDRVHRD